MVRVASILAEVLVRHAWYLLYYLHTHVCNHQQTNLSGKREPSKTHLHSAHSEVYPNGGGVFLQNLLDIEKEEHRIYLTNMARKQD